MPELKKVTMIDRGLENEDYAALQDKYPGIRMIWEIQMSHWTIRTDTIAFSSMKTCSQNFFITPNRNSVPINPSLPIPAPLHPLATTDLLAVSMDLSSLDISRKWNDQCARGRFCVLNLSPNLMLLRFICVVLSISSPFLFMTEL